VTIPTTAAIRRVVETHVQWAVRRIEYVAAQAAERGQWLTRQQLIKDAEARRYVTQPEVQQALEVGMALLEGQGDLRCTDESVDLLGLESLRADGPERIPPVDSLQAPSQAQIPWSGDSKE
jgi:hypothetical protein